jgi:hypothetical protein
MAVFETLTITIGFAIAKSTLKFWLKYTEILSDVTSDFLKVIKDKFTEFRIKNAAERQFGRIAEKAAESLAPIVQVEYRSLQDNEIEAVLYEVSRCINITPLTVEYLSSVNIDPRMLTRKIEKYANFSAFSAAETELIRRLINESSQLIIDFSGNLPGFTERTLACIPPIKRRF